MERLLSADEAQRAARYGFARDRRRFVVARATLRILLGRYLNLEPGRVRFCYGTHGKPALDALQCEGDLRFSLAHSEDLALYAIASGREVGVDLEWVRPLADLRQIAETFFSARERAALFELEPAHRPEAFYACWTRKEAYLKARGEGLALPLDQFDVSLAPGEPARLLGVRGDPRERQRWSLHALAPAAGCVAALAVEGHRWKLGRWQCPVQNIIPH
jgi:4'-phosphopantetheinyl transferase